MQPIDGAQWHDDLVGKVVGERYRINALSETDRLGCLYDGTDLESQGRVGIRITDNPAAHKRLQEWLGKAILSRGKDAILAAGMWIRRALMSCLPKPYWSTFTSAKYPEGSEWKRKSWWEHFLARDKKEDDNSK